MFGESRSDNLNKLSLPNGLKRPGFAAFTRIDQHKLINLSYDEAIFSASNWLVFYEQAGANMYLLVMVHVVARGKEIYKFRDNSISAKAYHRVKNIDNDGKSSYSAIVNYTNGKGVVSLNIFPVPVHSDLTVQHLTAGIRNSINVPSIDGRRSRHSKQVKVSANFYQRIINCKRNLFADFYK